MQKQRFLNDEFSSISSITCRTNSILSSSQSGFIPGDSTINQLTFLCNLFCQTPDTEHEIRVVFSDINKVFDCVWHAGWLCKLEAAGISGNLLVWLKNYLSDRKQRVILPGIVSDWSKILAGVPKGSILGYLLFLIFINNIVMKWALVFVYLQTTPAYL